MASKSAPAPVVVAADAPARSAPGSTAPAGQGRTPRLTAQQIRGLYTAEQSKEGFDSCLSLFPGKVALSPQLYDPGYSPQRWCSDAFAVMYSPLSKTPLVVVERLTALQVVQAREIPRVDNFFSDPRIPASARAELADYRDSVQSNGGRKDRGHLAPAANAPSTKAMAQSFALTNMVPQDPTHNRGVWAKLEADVRKFAERSPGAVVVYSGVLFEGTVQTVGANEVWVPSHLFKLVYDEQRQRAWAYVLENHPEARLSRPMDYPSFVQRTGLPLLNGLPVAGSIAH